LQGGKLVRLTSKNSASESQEKKIKQKNQILNNNLFGNLPGKLREHVSLRLGRRPIQVRSVSVQKTELEYTVQVQILILHIVLERRIMQHTPHTAGPGLNF
jgi:hypothetical protein